MKIGAFHTLELDLNQPFILSKENRDSMALEVIDQAASDSASSAADLAVFFYARRSSTYLSCWWEYDYYSCSY